LHLSWYKLT